MRYFWILPILGAAAAVFVIFITFAASKGAPQEAAGFALACAVAIIPYVFTRAVIGLAATSLGDSTDRIVNAIHHTPYTTHTTPERKT